MISGNIGARKTTLCKNLHNNLPNNVYKEEIFITNQDHEEFHKINAHNKETCKKYNKHVLPLHIEFLVINFKNEIDSNTVKTGYLIMDRYL